MKCRWLGWAGVELEYEGATLVIDPLLEPAGLYSQLGERAAQVELPAVVAARGGAVGGLVTHLHRDHADAGALIDALAPGAPVLMPAHTGPVGLRADTSQLQAQGELDSSALTQERVSAWDSFSLGPFTVTAMPAADGLGDPQVSWVVEAGGRRVFHGGDTVFHGWWWRIAEAFGGFDAAFLPINAAAVDFPWLQPTSGAPATLTPELAVRAGAALHAQTVVPTHFGGFELAPFYLPVADPLGRFKRAAATDAVAVTPLAVGGVM
jgi:L-ascorbate metabolism protein UlaG (beta-lactamase superfamily)